MRNLAEKEQSDEFVDQNCRLLDRFHKQRAEQGKEKFLCVSSVKVQSSILRPNHYTTTGLQADLVNSTVLKRDGSLLFFLSFSEEKKFFCSC
jgi:hypothetical protein